MAGDDRRADADGREFLDRYLAREADRHLQERQAGRPPCVVGIEESDEAIAAGGLQDVLPALRLATRAGLIW